MITKWATSARDGLLLALLRIVGRPVETVWAHPHDELQQMVYLTPLPTGVTLELQIYPGLLVAEQLASAIDLDGDISEDEAKAHISKLSSDISVSFDGSAVPLDLVDFSYPAPALIRQSAAAIVVLLAAKPLDSTRESHAVTLSYTHEPPNSTIQLNVTLSSREPMNVSRVEREPDGKSLTMLYSRPTA